MRILFTNKLNSNREIDSNGFLIARDCAVLRSGILNYRESEIGGDSDRIIKANLTDEELEKGIKTLGNKPILAKHSFIGSIKGGKEKPIGSIGDSLRIEKRQDGLSYLLGNICITDEESVDEIVKHKREQLSAGYTGDLVKSDNPNYDYEVKNIVFNHIALCKKGRCGSNVCIANSEDDENILIINEETDMEENKNENIANGCGSNKEIKDEKKEEKVETVEKKEDEVENKEVKNEDKKEMPNEIKISDGKREYDLKEIVKVLLDEVGYHKDNPVNDKTEKKEISNSLDVEEMRIQIANEVKESIKKENNKKITFYNSVKDYVGNIDILNYDLKGLADKTVELLKINLKNELSVEEKISFVNGYVEGLKANSLKKSFQNEESACKPDKFTVKY